MSEFGQWTSLDGLPGFRCAPQVPAEPWDPIIDPPTRRRWVHLGNRRITLVADTDGLSGLWDEHTGCDWLTEPVPRGTGVSQLTCTDGTTLTSEGTSPIFGPTFSTVTASTADVTLQRSVLCPEGERPWVLIRVEVANSGPEPARYTLTEQWAVRPRRVNLEIGPPQANPYEGPDLLLEAIGGDRLTGRGGMLTLATELAVAGGGRHVAWFRFGIDDGPLLREPAAVHAASLAALRERLPEAQADQAPEAAAEIGWHAALLTGGACADGVYGGHTLDQGSAYSFRHGFNGAARDPLQHALPLVYTEPALALSVLRNTCAWASPDGDLPWALDGHKRPWTHLFRPSDQNLWALWLAAEYAAATGDLAAFAEPLPGQDVSLRENLRRQFRFFTDVVGLGERGHVRILNADWNDLVLYEIDADPQAMIEKGESVLNSAMAAWVLPVYAGLAERLGDADTAAEARSLGERLRERVAGEWTGRWFRRAYAPGGACVGEKDLWLEVQPWAILCGAADDNQARHLLTEIDELCRAGSPLGARLRGLARGDGRDSAGGVGGAGQRGTAGGVGGAGQRGTAGGVGGAGQRSSVWYSINMTLIWAAARHRPDLAWDEWRRMALTNHQSAYPSVWEGTLSGPDCYLAPEGERPGRTWALPERGIAMQAYPVANLHSHAQPILAYLRLLGVEPDAAGRLHIGGGGTFRSPVLSVNSDGSGTLRATGPTEVVTAGGRTVGGTGLIAWD
jgi:hypothetical protein